MKTKNALYLRLGLVVIAVMSLAGLSHASNQAKAYFLAAEASFVDGDTSTALESLEEAKIILGGSNALLSALETKIHYERKDFQKAQEALDFFFTQDASDELLKEMSFYLVKIKKGKDWQYAKQEEERRKSIEEDVAKTQASKRIERLQSAIARKTFPDDTLKFSDDCMASFWSSSDYYDRSNNLALTKETQSGKLDFREDSVRYVDDGLVRFNRDFLKVYKKAGSKAKTSYTDTIEGQWNNSSIDDFRELHQLCKKYR